MGVVMRECLAIRREVNRVIDKELEELYLPHIERAVAEGKSLVSFPEVIPNPLHIRRLRELGYEVTYSKKENRTRIGGW